MKLVKRLCMAVLMITATAVICFGWIKAQAKVSGISVALAGNDEILIAESSTGEFGNSIDLTEDAEIKCAVSTDGKTFTDEKGNPSSAYYNKRLYIKAEKTVSARIECENPDESLRVAIGQGSKVAIFTPEEFGTLKEITSQTGTKEYFIRIWYDGATATEPTESVIGVVFE